MKELFAQVLNMSVTGSLVILAVMAARCLLRRAPKVFSYALWSVVLFRLLSPVSVCAPLSLLELLRPQIRQTVQTVTAVSYLPVPEGEASEFQYVPAAFQEIPAAEEAGISPERTAGDVAAGLWAAGVAAMVIYSLVQYLRLRLRLTDAIRCRENIFLADRTDTAFVMGILRPKIYLPIRLPDRERQLVLTHERCHIRRGDHVWKLLAYAALCVHWFNPLVWAAFVLAGKDMEMSCDEAVIRQLGPQVRSEYSASLLRLATHRKRISGMPLAFGEGDTKGRIMNMTKWKKPGLPASILCAVLCIGILAACAVNPRQETEAAPASTTHRVEEETVYMPTVPSDPEPAVNILLAVVPQEADTGKALRCALLLCLEPDGSAVTVQSVPTEKIVDLPDYAGHVTGTQPFRIGYALGYAWGGRPAAMEMTKMSMEEQFDVAVDYIAELTRSDVVRLVDTLGGIYVEDAFLDGEAAAVYAAQQEQESSPQEMEKCRLRQRRLLAEIMAAIGRGTDVDSGTFPALYPADDLEGQGRDWSVLLEPLRSGAEIYLGSMEENSGTDPEPVAGLEIVTNVELVQYGNLKLVLPAGYASHADDGAVVLTKDGTPVGGIRCYRTPDLPLDYSIAWLRALGLPEAQESGEPIAYMLGNSLYGDMEADFFHELKPEELNREHHFYIDGSLVYDLYYDQNILTDGKAERLLKTVQLNEIPQAPAKPEEADSLRQCRELLEHIRSGSARLTLDRENEGEYALNRTSHTVYTAAGEDWVSITHVPDDDSYHGYMYVKGKHYSNEGFGWAADGSVNWQPDPTPDAVYIPWLLGFRWDEELVSYVDTLYDADGKTVMLRIEEPLAGYEDLTECYFVHVHFTREGAFLRAQIQTDFIWENEYASVTVTEAVLTLDEAEISDCMDREYAAASGEN